jgi:hypothetical protein
LSFHTRFNTVIFRCNSDARSLVSESSSLNIQTISHVRLKSEIQTTSTSIPHRSPLKRESFPFSSKGSSSTFSTFPSHSLQLHPSHIPPPPLTSFLLLSPTPSCSHILHFTPWATNNQPRAHQQASPALNLHHPHLNTLHHLSLNNPASAVPHHPNHHPNHHLHSHHPNNSKIKDAQAPARNSGASALVPIRRTNHSKPVKVTQTRGSTLVLLSLSLNILRPPPPQSLLPPTTASLNFPSSARPSGSPGSKIHNTLSLKVKSKPSTKVKSGCRESGPQPRK